MPRNVRNIPSSSVTSELVIFRKLAEVYAFAMPPLMLFLAFVMSYFLPFAFPWPLLLRLTIFFVGGPIVVFHLSQHKYSETAKDFLLYSFVSSFFVVLFFVQLQDPIAMVGIAPFNLSYTFMARLFATGLGLFSILYVRGLDDER